MSGGVKRFEANSRKNGGGWDRKDRRNETYFYNNYVTFPSINDHLLMENEPLTPVCVTNVVDRSISRGTHWGFNSDLRDVKL